MANGSDDSQRGTLGTIRNASRLLHLLSEGPAYQQLTDLAERSGMSLPTVHRLLRSLVVAGLAEQHAETSRYSLGPEVARLSEAYLARLPVVRSLSPYLVQLRNVTKARIMVALLIGHEVVYVDRVDGEDSGMFRTCHRVLPALETAAGRVLLAHAVDEQWDEGVRDSASAVDTDERDRWAREPFHVIVPDDPHGEAEVAVPVFDERNRLVAALAAAGPAERFTRDVIIERLAPQLQRAARSATSSSGG